MYYKILSGKNGGSGSFLSPPGHPALTHSIYGWGSKSWATRAGADGASYIGSIDNALDADADKDLAVLAPAVRRLYASADMKCSEAWVRQVYGYFRNSYSPDGTDRNVSVSTTRKPLPADASDSERQTYAKTFPPERHLGYLHVRSYFPDHKPRLDLIADPGDGYGSHECPKCGQRVQYEARWDAFVVYPAGVDCPAGGRHE